MVAGGGGEGVARVWLRIHSWLLKFIFPTFLPARARGSILAGALEGCEAPATTREGGNREVGEDFETRLEEI